MWTTYVKTLSPWVYDVVSTSILGWTVETTSRRRQRDINVVVKTLHQRYRMDVVSTWNQGLFFDVNWQPKFNVVSTLFSGRWISVVELTLFQRGIRVNFSSTSFNDVVTTSCNRRQNDLHFQHFYNVASTDVWRRFNVVSTSFCPLGLGLSPSVSPLITLGNSFCNENHFYFFYWVNCISLKMYKFEFCTTTYLLHVYISACLLLNRLPEAILQKIF